MFVKLAVQVRDIGSARQWDDALEQITADYVEPIPGAKDKLIRVLRIMVTVWVSNTLRTAAENMIQELE